jgi:PD-(D/E)XK nuclease superfamily protein
MRCERGFFASSSNRTLRRFRRRLHSRSLAATYDVAVAEVLSKEELEAAHCWEADDRVPRRPELTAFRRRLRYHQSQWREAHGHPIGTQPIAPKPNSGAARLVGSRLPLAYARETGANFVTARALDAARARTSFIEPHQSFDQQRLWADLLWTPALAFNLFGDLAGDLGLADRAVHAWWPDAPGAVGDVRFAHSPGRLDPAWLGNLVAWDIGLVLDLGDGAQGIVGVMTAYHEVNKRQPPKPTRLPRYREITDRSGFFGPEAIDAVNGTELIHIWLGHLLVLSMLQHPSRAWRWGRLVVVHPAGNTDFADACSRYRALLVDQSTFASVTIEELLDTNVLPSRTTTALRKRYIA